MLKLKTTVAACLALLAIGSIIACSSQMAKSGSDAKTSSSPASTSASTPLPSARELAKADEAAPASEPAATTEIQTSGVPGSPSATTTISGEQLPAPDPQFGGVIKDGALQSKAWWAPRIVPPKKAPNILLIMTDDSGFGVPGTFGGVIPTPTMDRLAKTGLRYNNIHSTALC